MRWRLALLVVVVVAGGCGRFGTPPAPPRRAQLGLSMTSLVLGNGLRVVIVTDPNAREVQVTTRYAVGSAEDPGPKAGIAHLVEHLMFEQIFGAQSLFMQLETIATSFNAYTSYDSTVYFSRAAPEYLDKLLGIEAARVAFRCTSIAEAQFLRERDVVMAEVRQRAAFEELLASVNRGLFEAGHPYRRPIGGTLETVGSITFAEACAFANDHYTTDGTVLVVSGNVTVQQVTASLEKLWNRLAKRKKGIRTVVPRAEPSEEPVPVIAPVDDGAIVFAWALPAEPVDAVRAQALLPTLASLINSKVDGRVRARLFGGERARLMGIVVERNEGEDADVITKAVRTAVDDVFPEMLESTTTFELGQLAFDNVQQVAIHDLYSELEDGSDRDLRLAQYAGMGRDPAEALADEFKAVRDLSAANASALARSTFAYSRATVVELLPAERPQGRRVDAAPQPHDVGPRREVPSVDEAARPAVAREEPPVPLVTRTLENGMRVVLVSHASVPTVEIRLVFGAGSADEPPDRVGTAALAGYGLGFNPRHLNDAVKFFAAGGDTSVDVESDRTSFVVRGVDMHLDILLAGVRRWVREGKYGSSADAVANALRMAQKHRDEDSAIAKAWYPAVYGANHPYGREGLPPEATGLTVADAERFRAARFTPDNATLVIAGHFDVALAQKWVDYLFDDWDARGEGATRDLAPRVEPAAFAMAHDSTLTRLKIAFPADAPTRAQRLVVGAMLGALTRDISHHLGAAYSPTADLDERRRASRYLAIADVESSRAADAMKFLRDGLAAFATNRDAAARAFVLARKRVLVRLRSVPASPTLARHIERDIELGLPPLADLATAREVQALTFDAISPALADLDLAKAVVLARGPQADIAKVFEVLGKAPTALRFDVAAADVAADDPLAEETVEAPRKEERITVDDLEDALTGDPEHKKRLALRLTASKVAGHTTNNTQRITESCCDGWAASAFAGVRFDRQKALGLYFSVGSLEGNYYVDYNMNRRARVLETPLVIALAFEATAFGRLWASVHLGAHLDHKTIPTADTEPVREWSGGLGVGLQLGADVVSFAGHRLGLFIQGSGAPGAPSGYGGLGLGLTYAY